MSYSNRKSNKVSNEEILQYNQRWKGYLSIALTSLVNFSSVSGIKVKFSLKDERFVAIFGVVTFIASAVILILDRITFLHKRIDLKELYNGKLEGYILSFFVFWWVVGVALMTRAGGVAYQVLNTYFSAWYTLFMCLKTLDEWSTSKDIISVKELTRLSNTLPYWYILMVSSLIVMGSAADIYINIGQNEMNGVGAEYSIIVGASSATISFVAILVHYKLICCCNIEQGGAVEFIVAILLLLWWIFSVGYLTSDGLVGSTIQGAIDCKADDQENIPGSNLFLSLWTSLFTSFLVCSRWIEAEAMVKMSNVTQRVSQAQESIEVGEENHEQVARQDADSDDDI